MATRWLRKHGTLYIRYAVDRAADSVPLLSEFAEEGDALVSQPIVFAGRSVFRFLPAIGEYTLVFHAGEERIDCPLYHQQVGVLQRTEYVRGVCLVRAVDDGQDTELQYPFPHLAFDVLYHSCLFFAVGHDNEQEQIEQQPGETGGEDAAGGIDYPHERGVDVEILCQSGAYAPEHLVLRAG